MSAAEKTPSRILMDWMEANNVRLYGATPAMLVSVLESQEAAAPYLIREARAAELEAAAEHEASRSQTFMNTMEHMVESREYDHDDILRYGAYSAEAQTSACRLRARAAAIRAGAE